MKEQFTIGEISELMNIPTATLRFWEDSGLFSVEKRPNRYRSYTTRDITRIADVIFYRNLGISVSQVREMGNCTRAEYVKQMQGMQEQIEKELEKYTKMEQKVQRQLAHLEEVERLSKCDYVPENIPFDTVVSFDYLERDKLTCYIEDPSRYVRYFDTRDMSTETRGIISSSECNNSVPLWSKEPGTEFIAFLIREKVNKDYESDVEQSLAKIRLRYTTGRLLAQYLMTAVENGEVIDYLKAYLEVRRR